MARRKIVVAMMMHETNTFSPVPTPLASFRPLSGPAAIEEFRDTNTQLGGFLDVAKEANAEVIVPLAAGAHPSGYVEKSAYEDMCDAIVGACGAIAGTTVFQIKGFPYRLEDLMGDGDLSEAHRNGRYVTLRLTSAMYHRFHAPHDCRIEQVTYISGDTWNVNPIALKRVERLFCKNERAVLRTRLAASGHLITLVPVAAILVASIRLPFLDGVRDLRRLGRNVISCSADFAKGAEIGWFQHGSTIVLFAPDGFTLCDQVKEGAVIRMGQPLMRLP